MSANQFFFLCYTRNIVTVFVYSQKKVMLSLELLENVSFLGMYTRISRFKMRWYASEENSQNNFLFYLIRMLIVCILQFAVLA